MFQVIGPAIGYVVGGQFLDLHVDFDHDSKLPGISSSDPTWIGAWWLGFLIAWAFSWLCALFLFFYPSTLLNVKKSSAIPLSDNTIPGEEQKDTHICCEPLTPSSGVNVLNITKEVPSKKKEKSKIILLKDAGNRILELIKNPSYVLLVVGGALDFIMVVGLATFLPKFIMSQYGYTPSVSAVIMGIIITPAGGLGTLTGGYLVKRLKMTREQILKMYIACQFVAIPCLLGFICYCENSNVAGVNVPYPEKHQKASQLLKANLTSECNENCGQCGGMDNYDPVCGTDGYIYFNPCYAGCDNSVLDQNPSNYTNCLCIESQTSEPYGESSKTMDMCNTECKTFYIFVIGLFLSIWFSLMSGMTCIACIMRYVEPQNKSMSMGIAFIIAR